MKRAIFLSLLVMLFVSPANATTRRPLPHHHQNVIVLHDNSGNNQVAAALMIGLGVTLVVYAITREYRDCTRLTYKF